MKTILLCVNGRYRIVDVVGLGGHATTYRVEPVEGGQPLALKELALRGVRDWKIVELFEREGRTLRELDHPAIPRYVDAFEAESARGPCFYLARTLAPGRSLADRLATDWRPDEAEVRRIVDATLSILDYLHARTPAIVHRDVKPANLVLADDGTIRLVDFGAVQALLATQSGGSTLVGSYGFMAPEQLRGQATPAADLYGVAATTLYLATRKTVSDVPHRGSRPKLDGLGLSPALQHFIERGLEPDPEARFASVAAARRALSTPRRARRGSLVAAAAFACVIGAVIVHRHASVRTVALDRAPAPANDLTEQPSDAYADVRPTSVFHAHSGAITSMASSWSSRFVATGGEDGIAKVWQYPVMGSAATLTGHDGAVRALSFSQQDSTLYTIDKHALRGWDVATSTLRFTASVNGTAELTDLAVNSHGNWLAASTTDGTVILFDKDGIEQRTWQPSGAKRPLRTVAFHSLGGPHERTFLTAGDNGIIYQLDAGTGDELPPLYQGSTPVLKIVTEPSAAFAITEDRTLHRWVYRGIVGSQALPGNTPAFLDARFDFQVTADSQGVVRVWDRGIQPVRAFRDGSSSVATRALLFVGGDHVVMTGDAQGNVRQWRMEYGEYPVERQMTPREGDRRGWTALHEAAFAGDLPRVEAALASGISVDTLSANGRTALYLAAEAGRLPVVQRLVAAGAGLETQDVMNATALLGAAATDHSDVVAWLLDQGARTTPVTTRYETLWTTAINGGNTNVRHLLEQRHAPGRPTIDVHGSTPLCAVARRGSPLAVAELADMGFDVNRRCADGGTPLQIAAAQGHERTAKALLDHGASSTPAGDAPETIARRGGFIRLMAMLEHAAKNPQR